MIEERRRHRLIEAFIASHGEETAMDLADSLFSGQHATQADLKATEARLSDRIDGCATKTDLKATEARLSDRIDRCATKTDLAVLKTELASTETRLTDRLDNCATKTDVAVLSTRLDACATREGLSNLSSSLIKWCVVTVSTGITICIAVVTVFSAVLLNAISSISP